LLLWILRYAHLKSAIFYDGAQLAALHQLTFISAAVAILQYYCIAYHQRFRLQQLEAVLQQSNQQQHCIEKFGY
ncbi:hypothetical protein T10_13497, partial [Trichinella papuae]